MGFHNYSVQIYYEDTDHSGVVYHANYLKYFERAREHMLGVEELVRLYNEQGIGFVVYKADLTFRRGAQFGDILEIKSQIHLESAYRIIFQQNAHLQNENLPIVKAQIQLACVNQQKNLVQIPITVKEALLQCDFQFTPAKGRTK